MIKSFLHNLLCLLLLSVEGAFAISNFDDFGNKFNEFIKNPGASFPTAELDRLCTSTPDECILLIDKLSLPLPIDPRTRQALDHMCPNAHFQAVARQAKPSSVKYMLYYECGYQPTDDEKATYTQFRVTTVGQQISQSGRDVSVPFPEKEFKDLCADKDACKLLVNLGNFPKDAVKSLTTQERKIMELVCAHDNVRKAIDDLPQGDLRQNLMEICEYSGSNLLWYILIGAAVVLVVLVAGVYFLFLR